MELKPAGADRGIPIVLFFAVPEEARPFVRCWEKSTGGRARKLTGPGLAAWELGGLTVHVTGMGRRNATRVGAAVLSSVSTPAAVVTAGFAGGLNPALPSGTVLFEAEAGFASMAALPRTGARPARFHEATQVAVTPAAKAALWRSTGADAVEMESSTLRALARERGFPNATVRVISDAADEALPLDFNALMTPDDRLDFGKLAGALIRNPGTIPRLMKFQRTVSAAAGELARVLVAVLAK